MVFGDSTKMGGERDIPRLLEQKTSLAFGLGFIKAG